MKLNLIPRLLFACTVLSGCTTFHSQQVEKELNGSTRTTEVNASTFFDSQSDLSKLRASTTDKSQTTSIGSLDQSSSATNVVLLLDSIIGAAFQAGLKAAKP